MRLRVIGVVMPRPEIVVWIRGVVMPGLRLSPGSLMRPCQNPFRGGRGLGRAPKLSAHKEYSHSRPSPPPEKITDGMTHPHACPCAFTSGLETSPACACRDLQELERALASAYRLMPEPETSPASACREMQELPRAPASACRLTPEPEQAPCVCMQRHAGACEDPCICTQGDAKA